MKILFGIYQWCIACPIIIVATLLTAIGTLILAPFDKTYFGYYVPKWWARLWCWLLFVKVEVRGREKIDRNTSYLFVANHQGAYDIFSIYGFLGHNFRWMMRKGLTNIPLVGWACEESGAFKLAAEFNLPVVPITIDGSYQVMPRSTFNVTPGTIVLTMHEPIAPGSSQLDAKALAQECYDIIHADLPKSMQ